MGLGVLISNSEEREMWFGYFVIGSTFELGLMIWFER